MRELYSVCRFLFGFLIALAIIGSIMLLVVIYSFRNDIELMNKELDAACQKNRSQCYQIWRQIGPAESVARGGSLEMFHRIAKVGQIFSHWLISKDLPLFTE